MADRRKKNTHPNASGGVKPENLASSAVRGRSYKSPSGSGRAESAGYTTSSPGWRRDGAAPPRAASGGGGGGGKGGGGRKSSGGKKRGDSGDRGPRTTGAINGERAATPEVISNATTTPSALFEPLSNAGVNTPSALFQPPPTQSPTSVPGLPGFGAQSPSSLGTFLPTPGPTSVPNTPPTMSPSMAPSPPTMSPSMGDAAPNLGPTSVANSPPTMSPTSVPGTPDAVLQALLARHARQGPVPPVITPGQDSGSSPLGPGRSPLHNGKPVVPWFGV
jgi:hypothetical protein